MTKQQHEKKSFIALPGKGSCPKGALLLYFLNAPFLSLNSLLSLISNCQNLRFGTHGCSWRLKPIYYKQDTGNTERPSYPGAPQDPTLFHSQLTNSSFFKSDLKSDLTQYFHYHVSQTSQLHIHVPGIHWLIINPTFALLVLPARTGTLQMTTSRLPNLLTMSGSAKYYMEIRKGERN